MTFDALRCDSALRAAEALAADYERVIKFALSQGSGQLRVNDEEAEEIDETHVLCREEIPGGVVWKLRKRSLEQLP